MHWKDFGTMLFVWMKMNGKKNLKNILTMNNMKEVNMKKTTLLLGIIAILASSASVFAEGFDSLENITPAQKQKLTQIQYNYKQENNSLEMRIMDYNNKIAQVKNDKDKTPEQVSLLTSAYERNLSTLKTQQKILEQKTDAMYKSVLTPEQYNQYKAQQLNVQDSFNNFLQK